MEFLSSFIVYHLPSHQSYFSFGLLGDLNMYIEYCLFSRSAVYKLLSKYPSRVSEAFVSSQAISIYCSPTPVAEPCYYRSSTCKPGPGGMLCHESGSSIVHRALHYSIEGLALRTPGSTRVQMAQDIRRSLITTAKISHRKTTTKTSIISAGTSLRRSLMSLATMMENMDLPGDR